MRYIVAYKDSSLPTLLPLKRGFRHTVLFIAPNNHTPMIGMDYTREGFVLYTTDTSFYATLKTLRDDPQVNRIHFVNSTLDLPQTRCKQGLFGMFTCVKLVKTFLGIRNPFVITPYQLYNYLEKKICD